MTTPTETSASLRSRQAAAVVLGLVAAAFAWIVFYTEQFRGFPDSHFTDLDRAVARPATLVGYALVVVALYFFGAGTMFRKLTKWWHLALAALLLALLASTWSVGLDYYFRDLDNGVGGRAPQRESVQPRVAAS